MVDHLYELVAQRSGSCPTAVALGGRSGLTWKTVTSEQLLQLVDRLAEELASRGVQEGDRVVLWLPTHWQTPIYLFALWKLGAIVVPFDREMNADAAVRIIDSVQPRCIIVGYPDRPMWEGGRDVVDWWEPGKLATTARATSNWVRPAEELAAIFYTSGTTGNPKGCLITHANLCSQVEALRDNIPLDTSCRLASILPLSHLFELTCGLLYPLSRGAAIHYIPSRRGPDVLQVLSEQHITHMICVPQLLTTMGQALDQQLRKSLPAPVYAALMMAAVHLPFAGRRGLFWMVHRKLGGKLRFMASGGAALPAETQLLWERLGIRVAEGYGASECAPVIACGNADGSTPIGSVGLPLRGVAVRLGAEGELEVRGPNVMRGYWQDPVRSADVLKDGWYSTGDLATIDAGGNIRLAGRAKDLIALPSGMKVWPQDVEAVLVAQPGVKDAAVIAVATPGGGATLHAYLIPSSPVAIADVTDIVVHANAHLAQHQRIATASWWPNADFPRTSTLKVKRSLLPLPQAIAVVRVDAVLAADDPVGQAVAGVARVAAVRPGQTLGELGLDSLALVELALALEEKTDKAVADGDLRLDLTIEDLRNLLAKAPTIESESAAEAPEREQPLFPYTWGRWFRLLRIPIDLLYLYAVTRTSVVGGDLLANLPPQVIFAGTHHGFADTSLVFAGLRQTKARGKVRGLIIAIAAEGFLKSGLWIIIGKLALGLYPLRQRSDQDASLRELVRLARAAQSSILIFPQGVHTTPAREIARDPATRFHPGVAYLAAALNAPVVPFGVAGTEKVLPPAAADAKVRRIAGIPADLHRGPLAIAFGAPLVMAADESPATFVARLQDACFALARDAEATLE
jgi:long-chain acyl-CoA synthetase